MNFVSFHIPISTTNIGGTVSMIAWKTGEACDGGACRPSRWTWHGVGRLPQRRITEPARRGRCNRVNDYRARNQHVNEREGSSPNSFQTVSLTKPPSRIPN